MQVPLSRSFAARRGSASTVNDDTIQAMSKNTPLFGMSLTGKNVLTMLEGNIVYDDRA